MNHLSDLQCLALVDEALESEAAETAALHLAACDACRARVRVFERERQALRAALAAEQPAENALPVPPFQRPARLMNFALMNLATGLVIWLAQFLWKTLFGELVVNALGQITSAYLPDLYEVAVGALLYLLEEGTAMIDAYLGIVVAGLVGLTLVALSLKYRKSLGALNPGLVAGAIGLSAALLLPTSAEALEFRRSEGIVTVPATEVVDDTLLVAAETVVIEGTIEGDLVAAGRRVDISGEVKGNLFTFADTITVSGRVGGLVLGAADSFELDGATVGGDFWGAGEKVTIGNGSTVGRNGTMAAKIAAVEGRIQKDLTAFAEVVELKGSLGEDLEAFAERINLLGSAEIGGNLRFRTHDKNRLQGLESATVGGVVEYLALPDRVHRGSRYGHPEFYLWQLVRFASAFLVGLALLWLMPALRQVSLAGGLDGLKVAGIGLATVVSLPVLALLVAVTLVGLPFTVVTLFCWLLLIYLAKIVVAAYLGRTLLSGGDRGSSLWLSLVTGLAVVLVAVNIPAIGGVFNFLLTLVGVGLLAQMLYRHFSRRQAPGSV